ncbi:MAG: AarF/ABC1/UbiB kinase family protein, partial [Planctomycetota bacterium]
AKEFEELQSNAEPDAPEDVRHTVEAELGRSVDDVFSEFEETPIASASIGQVHRARLKSGERVVVKVQHAGIARKLEIDLDILIALATLMERMPEFAPYRPRALAQEFRRMLSRELDFTREARHMEQFARNFEGDPRIHIPQCHRALCTKRVLTMERLDGITLRDREALVRQGVDLEKIAKNGADIFLKMIFDHGLYHADPHPGNVVVLPGDVIGLYDYGMVGRIDDRLQDQIEEMLLAISGQDAEYLTAIITRVGAVPPGCDRASLSVDVSDFVNYYGHQPIDQFDLGGALTEMTEIIRRYKITLPTRVTLLIKTLISLEGTAQLASPRFNLVEVMRPYRRHMLAKRYSPRKIFRRSRQFYWQLQHLIEMLPQGLTDVFEQIQSGSFDIHLDHRGLEPSVNRLVLGLLSSALFIGSSLLLAGDVPPHLESVPFLTRWIELGAMRQLSLPGMVGVVLSALMGVRLWFAIKKSGKLEEH